MLLTLHKGPDWQTAGGGVIPKMVLPAWLLPRFCRLVMRMS